MKRRELVVGLASLGAGAVLGRPAMGIPQDGSGASTRDSHLTGSSSVVVQVLGTAQDGGFPHAGCYCSNCTRARNDPRSARRVASLGLYDLAEQRAFMVDATPDFRPQLDLLHAGLESKAADSRAVPDGILLSHAHIGHYTGLIFLGFESLDARGVPTFCSEKMRAFLAGNHPWRFMVDRGNLDLRTVQAGDVVPLTPRLRVKPFTVPHRDELSDTLGFIVSGPQRTLLYIPDIRNWDSWKDAFPEFVSQADIALLDGTFFGPNELPVRDMSSIGHPLIEDSMRILHGVAEKGKTRIAFTHLNHSNLALDPDSPERCAIYAAGFALAEEREELYL
ncbi:MAG: MBL fold metallo-hydrolase [Acidobacteriota bacterium]